MAMLLDIGRTASRLFHPAPTGIDRVERAYIDWASEIPDALFLVRRRDRVALLGRDAVADLLARQASGRWPGWAKAAVRVSPPRYHRRIAWRLIAARADAVGRLADLPQLLAGRGQDWTYLNVGHQFHDPTFWQALGHGTRTCLMLHDLIPLTHPQYCRDGVPEAFAARLGAALPHVDRLLFPSRHTESVFRDRYPGETIPSAVAPLGVKAGNPGGGRVHFLCLGTIEPRKNHALLLDIWERCPDLPPLLVAGRRGWANAKTFARLDAGVAGVEERGQVPQADLDEIWRGTIALLMPSHAEGYGLPLAEALARGVPVIASDLPSHREIAGAHATLLPPDAAEKWSEAIQQAAAGAGLSTAGWQRPRWSAHFHIVAGFLT